MEKVFCLLIFSLKLKKWFVLPFPYREYKNAVEDKQSLSEFFKYDAVQWFVGITTGDYAEATILDHHQLPVDQPQSELPIELEPPQSSQEVSEGDVRKLFNTL